MWQISFSRQEGIRWPGSYWRAFLFVVFLIASASFGVARAEAEGSGTTHWSHGPALSPVVPASFSVVASNRQLNVNAGGAVTLTSTIPVPSVQTTVVKDMSGAVVRTLVHEHRSAGVFRDAWDGKGEENTRLRDGLYRWVATFDDGSQCVEIDQSAQLDGDFEVKSHPEYQPWAAFDNEPLRISHTFERPGEIMVVFSPVTFPIYSNCEPPQFCRWLDGFDPAGPFTYEWAGVDDSGAYRPEVRGILVISSHERLAKNGIVVHGGRPRISSPKVSPPYYRPAAGRQEIAFSLQTYRNEHVSAAITWLNQASLSVLRTLTILDAAPGIVRATWDGRAEDGTLVAPGHYTVAVTVTDSVGHKAKAEILTTVVY